MDITTLVMTAGAKHKVHATSATTFTSPIIGVEVTAITFPDEEQAETFAAACMGDGVPALRCGTIDGEPAVAVMHR